MVKTKTVPASSHLVVMCGLFQDVSDKYSLHYPKLYAPGQRDLFFNKRVFAQSIAEAIASSVLLFFMSLGALSNCVNPAGLDVGNLTSFGFLIASILIVTVTLRVGRSVGRQRTYRGTKHTHTHTHTFNGPLSGTTRVSRYQKGKTNLDFIEARESEWQWHQLDHVQVCTSLQTDNYYFK